MQKNFFLNLNTRTLHIVGGCYHSSCLPYKIKYYMSEDEAIADETRYMSYCKLCFKNWREI